MTGLVNGRKRTLDSEHSISKRIQLEVEKTGLEALEALVSVAKESMSKPSLAQGQDISIICCDSPECSQPPAIDCALDCQFNPDDWLANNLLCCGIECEDNDKCGACTDTCLDETCEPIVSPGINGAITTGCAKCQTNDLFAGLDQGLIDQIMQCCCCSEELQQDQVAWTPEIHTGHITHPPEAHQHKTPTSLKQFLYPLLGASIPNDGLSAVQPFDLSALNMYQPQNQIIPIQQPIQQAYACEWTLCTQEFCTQIELVAHVNTVHLGVPLPHTHYVTNPPTHTHHQRHLRRHHHTHSPYGVRVRSQSSSSVSSVGGKAIERHQREASLASSSQGESPDPHIHSQTVMPLPPLLHVQDQSGTGEEHKCQWKSCTLSFPSSGELMTHLSHDHVGSGKGMYWCEWTGCIRCPEAGEKEGKGFTQRQKLMRHLMSHTGDRPFKCEICGKGFSESTTLTQHMRVHTQEKPFSCVFEGCNKSFALASALTIHMRTHTGSKPFKCTYPGCTSAFTESSNLSKHLKTHLVERNYGCNICGKRFSRSDQLARHSRIHETEEMETN